MPRGFSKSGSISPRNRIQVTVDPLLQLHSKREAGSASCVRVEFSEEKREPTFHLLGLQIRYIETLGSHGLDLS